MNKILYISYVFPPMTAGGVFRSFHFVRYLPEYGWLPTVLTVRLDRTAVVDRQILDKLPKQVDVVRANSLERIFGYTRGKKYSGKADRISMVDSVKRIIDSLLFPDRHLLWLPWALFSACRLLLRGNYRVILATYRPATNLLLGYLLKRIFAVKLVLDFRDLWADEIGYTYGEFRRFLLGILERKIVRSADHIITVVDTMSKHFIEKYGLDPARVSTITNGFDPDLPGHFIHYDGDTNESRMTERLTITYTGSLYGKRGPERLFQAMQQLISDNPDVKRCMRLVFVGNLDDKLVGGYNLSESVEIHGFVPHHDVINFLKNANVLLLLVNKENRDISVTGKLFEYMATGKPVLALVPEEGVAADMLKQAGVGRIVNPDDTESIYNTIEQLYDDWKSNRLVVQPNWNFIEQFDRRKLTEKLAGVLANLTASKTSNRSRV